MLWPLCKNVLFRADAEHAHRLAMGVLKHWPSGLGRAVPNPLGLAAGFDKNGECLLAWQALGFGFVEVGTVTAHAQPGNPKPRLFRLPKDLALFNRMGFNNEGASNVAQRIAATRQTGCLAIPIGVNIGKSKIVDIQDANDDYLSAFNQVADVADYVAINVSSPNTPQLRELQNSERLASLLDTLSNANQSRKNPLPLFLKLAPDLTDEMAITASTTALKYGLTGLIISNTTTSRSNLTEQVPSGDGGISGKPVFLRSTTLLSLLHKEIGEKLILIGAGGIIDSNTARQKLDAGADLLQVYTGFIYGGPLFARQILRELSLAPQLC